MIKLSLFFLIISLFFSCSKGKKPNPDNTNDNISENQSFSSAMDSISTYQKNKFYQLEEDIESIQKEIEILETRVAKYKEGNNTSDYSKQLKKIIDNSMPSHKIFLNNGSIIECTIEKDNVNSLLVQTEVGKLIINKSDIKKINDLIVPSADIVFVGHGQEKIYNNYRIFSGKIINQGARRGDFVRIIYNLWSENTELLISDSSFISGTQFIYESGIVSDAILDPKKSKRFNVKVSIPDSINVAYITRDIRWELYD